MRTKTCLMFCMASEKALSESCCQKETGRSRWNLKVKFFLAGRAYAEIRRLESQPDTCEVSETIYRMLLGVNSFLSLSKDNATAGAPARRLGAIAIVRLS